jgi:hypothetical protein
VSTLVNFHLGALIYITMKRLITVISAVWHLVAHQMVVNTLSIVTHKLALCTLLLFFFFWITQTNMLESSNHYLPTKLEINFHNFSTCWKEMLLNISRKYTPVWSKNSFWMYSHLSHLSRLKNGCWITKTVFGFCTSKLRYICQFLLSQTHRKAVPCFCGSFTSQWKHNKLCMRQNRFDSLQFVYFLTIIQISVADVCIETWYHCTELLDMQQNKCWKLNRISQIRCMLCYFKKYAEHGLLLQRDELEVIT